MSQTCAEAGFVAARTFMTDWGPADGVVTAQVVIAQVTTNVVTNRVVTNWAQPPNGLLSGGQLVTRTLRITRSADAQLKLWLIGVPWVATLATLGLYLIVPDLVSAHALYPLLLGTVFLALPHGALDHLVPVRSGLVWARRPWPLTLYFTAYLALAALYFGLWLLSPQVAFVGFLLLTVLHWGQGDGRFLELSLGRRRPTRWGALTTLLLRGMLPIVLPILAFPDTAASLYHHAALGLGLGVSTVNLKSPWLVGLLLSFTVLVFARYLLNAVRAAPNPTVLAVDLTEIFLLTALFTLVPAYVAVGVYFAFWHSLRHLGRLLLLGEQGGEGTVPLTAAVRRLSFDLLPLTLLALALLAGVYLVNAARVVTLEGFVALYLVLISALTVPHAAVVALMDRWRV